MTLSRTLCVLILATSSLAACGDPGGGDDDPPEVITTVTLTFTPPSPGTPVVAAFDDPDGDGGMPPTVDPINLPDGVSYALAIAFANRLEDPPEDITQEIRDEGDQHQVFLTNTAVNGPASDVPLAPLQHAYADMDARGLPIGLANTIVTGQGTGMLTVTLRHLPPIGGTDTKVADLASFVRTDGLDSIGGESDAQVTFMVTAGAPTPP
jgi:hypothetical protein